MADCVGFIDFAWCLFNSPDRHNVVTSRTRILCTFRRTIRKTIIKKTSTLDDNYYHRHRRWNSVKYTSTGYCNGHRISILAHQNAVPERFYSCATSTTQCTVSTYNGFNAPECLPFTYYITLNSFLCLLFYGRFIVQSTMIIFVRIFIIGAYIL